MEFNILVGEPILSTITLTIAVVATQGLQLATAQAELHLSLLHAAFCHLNQRQISCAGA